MLFKFVSKVKRYDIRQETWLSSYLFFKGVELLRKIFLSYRHVEPDEKLANFMFDFFKDRGYDVFIDKQILVGQKWVREIEKRIRTCNYFIVLLSKESIQSDMVREEIMLARKLAESEDILILPVRVDFSGALPYDLGVHLKSIHFYYWRAVDAFETVSEELLKTIHEEIEILPSVEIQDKTSTIN